MSDPRTNPYYLLGDDGELVASDIVHKHIHDGNYFNVMHTWTALADNGTAQMLIVPPANSAMHVTWRATVGGDSYGFLYEGTVITGASGTALSAHRVNRQIGGTGAAKIFYGVEGVSATGTPLITSSYIAGGAGPLSVGGEARAGSEWPLSAGGRYLMRLVNHGGGAKTAMIDLEWYED